MVNPVFILKDSLLPGSYLLGNFVWTEAMRLESASLIGVPPSVGTLVLALEVAGSLTEKRFTIAPSDLGEVRQSLNLGIKLTSGQSVRWVVVEYDGEVETAADHVAITLTLRREVDAVVTDQPMSVWWKNGIERLKLFTYDPVTHVFTAVNAALASTRAGITQGATFSITIQSAEVLRVRADRLR